MTLHFTKDKAEKYSRDDRFDRLWAEDWLALYAENERLLAVLAQVEWVWLWAGGMSEETCPWCNHEKWEDHAPNCPRQAAMSGR